MCGSQRPGPGSSALPIWNLTQANQFPGSLTGWAQWRWACRCGFPARLREALRASETLAALHAPSMRLQWRRPCPSSRRAPVVSQVSHFPACCGQPGEGSVAQPQHVRCHESYMGALAGVNRCSTAGEGQPAWERAHLGGRGAGRRKGFRNQVLQASLETLNQAAPAARSALDSSAMRCNDLSLPELQGSVGSSPHWRRPSDVRATLLGASGHYLISSSQCSVRNMNVSASEWSRTWLGRLNVLPTIKQL